MNPPRLAVSVRLLLAAAGSLVLQDFAAPSAAAAPEISIEEAGVPLGTGLVASWGDNFNGQTSIPPGLSGVRAISAGYSHALALKNDGTVIAWGNNSSGQTSVPTGLTGVQAISTNTGHTLALKSDGTVTGWGYNYYGQATAPVGLTGVKALAAGWNHSVALKEDGTVVAWGYNLSGQATVPAGLAGVKAIAAGSAHTVALKNDGTVVAWGSSTSFSNMPAGLSGVQAIAAGEYHTMALKGDGTVVVWGYNSDGQLIVPVGLSGVKAIAAGEYHSVALKEDGTVVAWGKNDVGQATVPAGLRGVRAVSASRNNTAVITNSTVVFGDQPFGVTSAAKTFTIRNTGDSQLDLSAVSLLGDQSAEFSVSTTGMLTSIPAGGQTTFTVAFTPAGGGVRRANLRVLSNDADEGTFDLNLTGARSFPDIVVEQPAATPLATAGVAAWGWNGYQQTNLPAGLSGVRAIAATTWHTAALRNDGTVVTWGGTTAGQAPIPAGLGNVIAVAAGQNHTLALKADGKVIGWPLYQNFQTDAPAGLSGVSAVAAGENHSLALKTDGTVVAWGQNTYGQTTVPAGLSAVQAISANGAHSVALKTDGTVVAWGRNSDGENTVPAGLSGVTAIAAGVYHTVALKSDGTVVAWGRNSSGQTSVPAGLGDVRAIAAGNSHTVALKRDGSIVSWGGNTSGQATPPAGLTGVTAISAGGSHTVALLDSTVDFGNHALGEPGEAKTFTIRNSGADALHISSVSLNGDSAANFTLDASGVPATVPPGGLTTCTVAFNPAAPGVKRALLRVVSDDPDENPFDVALTGSVIPEIAVFTGASTNPADERFDNEGSHAFPDTFLGSSSAAQTFTIKNTGLSGLTDIAVSITGVHPGDFVCSAPGANTLAPGAATTFTVYFAPTVQGKRDAVIAIASNDLDENPFEIRVTGNNPAPEISIENPANGPLATGIAIAWGFNTYGQSTVPAFALSGVRAISAGDHHTVVLKGDGSVAAWGSNEEGQADVPLGLAGVQAIAAGWFHTLALKGDGTVVAWGYNFYGQSTVPAGLAGVRSIAGGLYHTLALKNDGTVVAWGDNSYGQRSVPSGLTGVQAIAAGLNHSLALRSNGTISAWGNNSYAQSIVPTGLTGVQAIAAGLDHSVALKTDGTVVVWGSNQYGQKNVPAGLTGVKAISAGEFHTVALKEDGTIVAWGNNAYGQLNVPSGLTGVKAISAGDSNTAVLVDSQVACGGQGLGSPGVPQSFTIRNTGNDNLIISDVKTQGGDAADFSVNVSGMSATVSPGGQTSFTVIFTPSAAGARRTTLRVTNNDRDEGDFDVALTGTGLLPEISIEQGATVLQTGTVVAWGNNSSGQATVPAGLSGVRAISAGSSLSLAVKGDGSVVAWGSNSSGQATPPPTAKSGVVGVAAGSTHAVAVKSDGSVIGWGVNGSGQATPPAGLTGVSAVAVGSAHSLALRSDGTGVGWGSNVGGRATFPSNAQSGIQAIAANSVRSMVLKSDGTVIAWGDNNYGQSTVPAGLTDVRAIAAGSRHSMALKNDGTIVAWGDNSFDQTTIPANLTGLRSIATNGLHNLALKDDGTVVAWGYNYYGQTNIPAGLTGVKAVSAGGDYSLALLDSTVAFGSQIIGTTGEARSFTIRNTGVAPLHITGISPVDGNASNFGIDTSGMVTPVPVGGQTTFSATFSPAGSGFRKTTLRVLNNDSDEGIFDIVLAGTGLTPLESWRQFHFGMTSNAGAAADGADSDHDGLPNLVEFAFGTDPTASTPAGHRPQASMVSGQVVITYRRPVGGVPGIACNLEKSSGNLSGWSPAPATDYVLSLSDNGDGTETVAITWIGEVLDNGFFRIAVSY